MERDKFENIFRERLRGVESQESIPDWEEFSKKLISESPVRPFYRRYWGVAASLLALVSLSPVVYNSLNRSETAFIALEGKTEEMPSKEVKRSIAKKDNALGETDKQTELLAFGGRSVEEDSYQQTDRIAASGKAVVHDLDKSAGAFAEDSPAESTPAESTPAESIPAESDDSQYGRESLEDKIRQFEQEGREAKRTYSIPKPKKEKGLRVGLLASNFSSSKKMNSSNGTSLIYEEVYFSNVYAPVSLRSQDYNREFQFDHKIPLTTGLSIAFSLNNRLSIESGLTYSFLSSSFKKEEYPINKGEQELHYLGVPVNVLYEFFSWGRLRLYAGAGGRVDFNVRASQKSEVRAASVKEHFRDSDPVWSLRAKGGVGVELFKRVEVYVEPAISRYFTNSDLRSRWSDHPLNVELQFGLRTNF